MTAVWIHTNKSTKGINDENSQVRKISLQDFLSMKGLGSMKKEFQSLNSSKQIKPMCGRAQKPNLTTIEP